MTQKQAQKYKQPEQSCKVASSFSPLYLFPVPFVLSHSKSNASQLDLNAESVTALRHVSISSISYGFIDSAFLCSSSSWQYKEWADDILPRLEAILWLSSELSNVTNGKPWRTFGGITQKQSLKQRGGELCLQMHFGSRYFAIFETSILAADEAQVLIGVKINQKWNYN